MGEDFTDDNLQKKSLGLLCSQTKELFHWMGLNAVETRLTILIH